MSSGGVVAGTARVRGAGSWADHRHPVQCIVPPYMLEAIIASGSEAQRRAALEVLRRSDLLRQQRALAQAQPRLDLESMAPSVDAHSSRRVRRTYDARHGDSLPGVLARGESDGPTGDPAVDEAHDGAGATWDLYWQEYKRNSLDDRGKIIDQTVHYGERFDNAFWNGEQMVYGDGDGEIFARFTIDVDIIAHELTHGVTQYEANLRYWYQSGALNESFSDVFASLVKQRLLGQEAAQADWLIGAGVLLGDQYALRSLKAPGTAYVHHPALGTDPQPATMDGYRELPAWDDNGGVHINSGIPNHAFYLAAMELGGQAWRKAGLIWYRALCNELDANANFLRAAQATVRVARAEFGAGSVEERAVTKAWPGVKVL